VIIWFSAQLALACAAMLAAGRGGIRIALLASLLAVGTVLPWFAPLSPVAVVLLSFISVLAVLKSTQIAALRQPWPWWMRLWHLFGVSDMRGARRVTPMLDGRALFATALFGALAALAFCLLHRIGQPRMPVWWVARILSAATLMYAAFEVLSGTLRIGYLAFGVEVPPVQRAPIKSLSLAEFWGRRWNLVVSGWLREFVFLPLARRRRPQLARAAAFGASGAYHAWMVFALGAEAVALMGLYFLLHGAAVVIEPRIGVLHARPLIARIWVLATLLIPLPLLSEGWLRALGI
jgi:hypothetical protein